MKLCEIENFALNHNDNELCGKTTHNIISLTKDICRFFKKMQL